MQDDNLLNTPVAEVPVAQQPPVVVVEKPKKEKRQRHYLIAFFFSFMWGTFGVDRIYMGYIGTGILKLITFGGFGIWTIVDFIFIITGFMKDKQGREMLQVAEYKKFANRTVLWFAIILGLVVLINGIIAIETIFSLITSLQDGGGGIGGLLKSSGVSADQLQSAGVDPSMLGL